MLYLQNLSMQLLKKLCQIHAPSGNEVAMKDFILDFINKNAKKWKVKPTVLHGEGFQDNIILVFGKKPKTAVFAHIDSIGFTVRYNNQLVPIGGPEVKNGWKLTGSDSKGKIETKLVVDEQKGNKISCDYHHEIDRGTELVFKSIFKETEDFVQSCYMDNRLGVWTCLNLCGTLENGIIVFSTWEEAGGGSVPYLAKYIHEHYGIKQTLICDITWVTEGVEHGKGVAISMRDRFIPRRAYVEKIIALAKKHKVHYQLEVEGAGSSDGREIQFSEYAMDWCFIGAPEANVHSPMEKVHKEDIKQMLKLYEVLMKHL